MKIIAILQRKGGVGKTSIATGLAAVLSKTTKHPVELLDCDPTQAAAEWLDGGEHRFTVTPAGTNISLTKRLNQHRREPDAPGYLIADLPPHDATTATQLYAVANLILVPCTPCGMDVKVAQPLIETIIEGDVPGIIVLNQVDKRTKARRLARAALKNMGVPVAKTELVTRIIHRDATLTGQAVPELDPSGPATQELIALSREVLKHLKE